MSVNVQVRIPEKLLEIIDEEVREGEFESRSDAIRTILEFYAYEKNRNDFYKALEKRVEEIKKGKYVTLEQLEKELLA